MKIAIVSGKGGTGKSSISAALIAQHSNIIAIDCDVDASNLPILFSHKKERIESFASGTKLTIDYSKCTRCGICQKNCNFHALSMTEEGINVNEILCEACELCVHLCPQKAISIEEIANSYIYRSSFKHGILIHGHLFPGDDNSGKMIARLREIADEEMKRNNIEIQILDGPPGIGCPVMSTITGMNKLVIVTEPTKSGISDLKRIYQSSINFCRDISVIINKYDINPYEHRAIKDLCKSLKLPLVGEIPFDKQIVMAQINNETIMTYAPSSPCAMEMKNIKERLF